MPDSSAEFNQPLASPELEEATAQSDVDTIVFDGQVVGYIDRDGNIRLSADDRVIGHIANDRDRAIQVLRDRYLQFVEQTREWIDATRADENRLWRISDTDNRIREIDQQYVLGSLDTVREMLTELGDDLRSEQAERIEERRRLISEADEFASRTDWKAAGIAFDDLNERFKAVGSVGDHAQDAAQWDGFKALERAFRARRKQHFDQMEQEYAERAKAKEAICETAESLEQSPDMKAASVQMRELMDEWKSIGFAGREHDDALWERFQLARNAFFERRQLWFARNAAEKELLATKAEALADLEDAAAAHNQMKPLMQQWRAIGSAGKEADEALWSRFRAAQEDVYQRSRAVFKAREEDRQRNFDAKQALIAEVEGLVGEDSRTATNRCKEIQREWKEIGPVPRDHSEQQWQRFRAACDSIFRIASAHGKRRIEDARDHAEGQIRKLSAEIDEHERKIAHWEGVIANLRDGDGAEEIREAMNAKIATVKERIEDKLGWIEEQHARMTELSRKL